jgi:TolA-binding protein
MAEIRFERGWAWYHQQQWESAVREFEAVAEGCTNVLGARAQFMLGEVQFARRQYDDAVRTFFQVAYGYGDADAPPAFHRWQAEALFEAARCLEQTHRLDSARQLYKELVERFPDSTKATHARVALKQATTK